MNCEILNTLYIRSNGDIPCDDDNGEKIILGRVEPGQPDWDILAVLNNRYYSHIRDAFAQGRTPWPDTCPNCAFLRPHEAYNDRIAIRQLHKVQVEPSRACQIETRPKPFLMDPGLFEAALRSLTSASFVIAEIEYCGQGEPLLHPNFNQFVRLAREYFPNALQRLITAGTVDYTQTVGSQLDEIFISRDRLLQESYEQYRIRGQVDTVLQFMKDACKGSHKSLIVWKYILFEHNDSDTEIYQAQKLAQTIGVDRIDFVFTHSPNKSKRYTIKNAASFPRHFPNVGTNATPIHYQDSNTTIAAPLRRFEPQPPPIPVVSERLICVIDEVIIVCGQYLYIRGWALTQESPLSINVLIDNHLIGIAKTGYARHDVSASHPEYCNKNSGFLYNGVLPEQLYGSHRVDVVLSTAVDFVSLRQMYNFS
jgi:hypothetical protein